MTNTSHLPRRRTVVAMAAGTAAAIAAALVLLPGDAASAAVLDAATRTGKTSTLRADLNAGTSTANGEFAGDDSKIVYNDAGTVVTVVEVGDVRYSFAGNGRNGVDRVAIGDDEPRRAPIAESAAAVVRALVDDGNVTKVGDEKVRGTAATHYRVAVSDATRRNLSGVSTTKRVWFELEQVDNLRTVDVWVSDQLIRRITVQGPAATPKVTEFFDFGAPITIRAPKS